MNMQQKKYLDILNEAWQEHLKSKRKNAPTVISTFAGCGGSSLGYSMAGYKELLAVEWNSNAVKTFKLNFPGIPVYHGDIAKLSVKECLKLAGIKEGELDILDGSPPCQGFSTAGKRKFSDTRNQLFKEYVRLLRGLRPKVFVMENVAGMVKGIMKIIFAEIMRELKASGYDVSARLMNAMYFNVPQSRERMIFIGVRKDLYINPSHPKPLFTKVKVSDALFAIPNYADNSSVIISEKVINRYNNTKPGKTLYNFGCGHVRLNLNNISPALHREGDASYSMFHPIEPRPLYVSEMKRIASYPDKFNMSGNYKDKKDCIGNSVPPLFMRVIAQHIKQNILI